MAEALHFDAVLDAAEQLPTEDQESLIDILKRRLIEARRAAIVHDVEAATEEHRAGGTSTASPDELSPLSRCSTPPCPPTRNRR